jgi:hypothetical protein
MSAPWSRWEVKRTNPGHRRKTGFDPFATWRDKQRMACSPQTWKEPIARTFLVFAIALEFGSEQIIFPLCAYDQN